MPTCKFCNAEFSTPEEFRLHECDAFSEVTKPDAGEPFAERAAGWSWRLPLAGIVLSLATTQLHIPQPHAGYLGLIAISTYVIGFVCALIGIYGALIDKRKGIIIPSVIGLLLNGAIIWVVIASFFILQKVREEQRRHEHETKLIDEREP